MQALLRQLIVNGIHGPVGAPAASHVVMVEHRAEQGQARKSNKTVQEDAMGHAMRHRHAGSGLVRVRHHKKFNITVVHTTIPFSVDCEWEEWFSWSPCNPSCGNGNQTRTRTRIRALFGGKKCEGNPEQARNCSVKPCPGIRYISFQ